MNRSMIVSLVPLFVATGLALVMAMPVPARADAIDELLAKIAPHAALVGRKSEGDGYVLMNINRGYRLKRWPDGGVDVETVEPKQLGKFKQAIARHGWRV